MEGHKLIESVNKPVAARESPRRRPTINVLRIRDFRLLWLGQAVSLLGNQFTSIALPWLVLKLTGDALAMGTVLALVGLPRAIFMLFGGALTDRFSPRSLMLVTNLARMILVAGLAVVILTNHVQMWLIYLVAVLFGLIDAFFLPAVNAIIPTILPRRYYQIGNTLLQGTSQVSVFLGPVAAGLVISFFGGASEAGSGNGGLELQGIGLAFALDALTFLFSVWTLYLIQSRPITAPEKTERVWGAIREGMMYVWQDMTLRTVFVMVASLAVLGVAPITIGVPLIADSRMAYGAASFGLLMSAYGAGSLLGIGLGGVLPKPAGPRLGIRLFSATAGVGLLVAGLALAQTMWAAASLLLAIGLIFGYLLIQCTTWLQLRVPDRLLGRIMSLLLFAFAGLAPVGNVIYGALITWDLGGVLLVSGLLLTCLALLAARQPSIQMMGMSAVPASDAVKERVF